MNKRILILLAVLALGAVAAVISGNRAPHAPLVAEIVSAGPGYGGGWDIICLVTNRTAQPYLLLAAVEGFFNENWKPQPILVNGGSGYVLVAPHASAHIKSWTHQISGTLRVSVRYGKDKTPRQHQIDSWLSKLHMGPLFNDRLGGHITTSPTNFPAR